MEFISNSFSDSDNHVDSDNFSDDITIQSGRKLREKKNKFNDPKEMSERRNN